MPTIMSFKLCGIVQKSQVSVVPIRINIERMAASLSDASILAPRGMSREEKRKFILNAGANH